MLEGEVAATAQVIRSGHRQGTVVVIPALSLMDLTGSGQVTFQEEQTTFVFTQSQGGVSKRHYVIADWDQALEDAIQDGGLNPIEPINAGDILRIPGIQPSDYTVDNANAWPGDHITIYTHIVPGNA